VAKQNTASKREAATSRELSAALEQQAASTEVLGIISSSPTDLKPVFETILANATRLCEASYGALLMSEGDAFRRVAHCNAPQALLDEWRKNPVIHPLANSALDRVAKTKQVVHVTDARAEPSPAYLARLAGARTVIGVPMLKEDELIGYIGIYRPEV